MPSSHPYLAADAPVMFRLEQSTNLLYILSQRGHLFCENPSDSAFPRHELRFLCDASPDFGLSVTTHGAWRGDIARTLALALSRRFGLSGATNMVAATCLHEALTNAIIHGNLRLSLRTFSWPRIERYYASIERRVLREPFKSRRIRIMAWHKRTALLLTVRDEGAGFTLPTPGVRPGMPPQGRGLGLIMALADDVWLDEGGRRLCISISSYPHKERPHGQHIRNDSGRAPA